MGTDASYMNRLLSLNKRLILTGQSYCWMLRKMTNTIHIKLTVTMGNDAINKYGTFIFEQKTDHNWYVYVTFWFPKWTTIRKWSITFVSTYYYKNYAALN